MSDLISTICFILMFVFPYSMLLVLLLKYFKIEKLSDELTFYKEKYEQLKLDQIQELLDDRDFGNND